MAEDDEYRKVVGEWIEAIDAFEIDDGPADYSFADRLADEQGWSPQFTERVIREYKRFIVLMVVAGHPVTPSREVDEAWHLHITFTHSYVDRLCGELIGRMLHHNPTKGGDAEADKFYKQYEDTLSSYVLVFGEDPPSDIWPGPAYRFSADAASAGSQEEVPTWLLVAPFVFFGICLVLVPVLIFMKESDPDSALRGFTQLICLVSGILAIVLLIIAAGKTSDGRRGSDGGGGGGFFGCGGGGCGGDGGGCGGGGCGGGCGGG